LSDTGMQKIVAFKKQWLASGLCQSVRETISEVQPGGVAASAAEIAVSFTRDFRLLLGHGSMDIPPSRSKSSKRRLAMGSQVTTPPYSAEGAPDARELPP